MLLLCSGAGGLKADCAFCPSGSDAAEECAAVGTSLLVINPFHFQNQYLLVSSTGGLGDLKGEQHPLIRDELNDTYWCVQQLTQRKKYKRGNWVFSSAY